jgi:hypothetical protein
MTIIQPTIRIMFIGFQETRIVCHILNRDLSIDRNIICIKLSISRIKPNRGLVKLFTISCIIHLIFILQSTLLHLPPLFNLISMSEREKVKLLLFPLFNWLVLVMSLIKFLSVIYFHEGSFMLVVFIEFVLLFHF